MKYLVMSVYDIKTGAFMPPFVVRAKGEAIRSFTDAIGSKDHQFARHPEDYRLSQLGTFDDANGALLSDVQPVISGVECVVRDDSLMHPRIPG